MRARSPGRIITQMVSQGTNHRNRQGKYETASRSDKINALSVSLNGPHKFRRTTATRTIEKGMPIEQVQKIFDRSRLIRRLDMLW